MATVLLTKETWATESTTELCNITQGHKALIRSGTNTVFFLDHESIKNIPMEGKITYAHIVVDYRQQKSDPNRVRIAVGRHLIEYPHKVTMCLTDLDTAKIL